MLAQRYNKLILFISDIMDYLLAGEDHPQTNQPNSQAVGKPYLKTWLTTKSATA